MEWISLILSIAAGLLLLFAGRKFFWLAAALVAFLFTFNLFEALFGGGWLGLIVALVAGAIFAWLATRYIKLIGELVGALAGGVGLPIVLSQLGIHWSYLLEAAIGALLGFLLMRFLFDWGLILLTSWAGASAVSGTVGGRWSLGTWIVSLLFVVLFAAGVFVQARQKNQKS